MSAFLDAHTRGRRVALRTSGSTKASRMVVRTTQSWVCSFPPLTTLLEMDSSSRIWIPGPLTSTMNLFAAVHAQFLGARQVEDPGHATHAHLTPTTLSLALHRSSALQGAQVVVSGDRLPGSLSENARAAGIRVHHYYGAAELSFVAWGTSADDLRLFPEVEISVREGVLWVRSPYLSEGYAMGHGSGFWTDHDGFATVGDRGGFADGYLHVSGRGSTAVTTGGATVLVADVEDVLRPVVEGDVFVIGLPHHELGQVVVAVLTEARSLARARAHSRSQLSPHQQPRAWFEVTQLPRTHGDKLDRLALAELLVSRGKDVRRLT